MFPRYNRRRRSEVHLVSMSVATLPTPHPLSGCHYTVTSARRYYDDTITMLSRPARPSNQMISRISMWRRPSENPTFLAVAVYMSI
jgi:hypothetical protein